MKYSDFCENVKNELQRMMGEEYNVRLEHVIKNNHVTYVAVVILQKNRHIAPSINLQEYYDSYGEGMNITNICLSLLVQYEKYKDGVEFDSYEFMDYERIKNKLYVKVINKAKNEQILDNVPHVDYYDLAMVSYILFDVEEGRRATMNISNTHLKVWGIDSEKLFKDAIDNTRKRMPPKVEKISDVMKEILADKIKGLGYKVGEDEAFDRALASYFQTIENSENDKMLILTNNYKMDGAVFMLFDDVLEAIADELDCDIYVIPSSIHEVMIIPKYESVDYNELGELVNYVNETDLSPMEVLSDNVYVYEKGRGIAWTSNK